MVYYIVALVLVLCGVSESKVNFVKDLKMDAQFPVPIRRDGGMPEGHLRPLGHQRAPDAPIEELEGFPENRVFYFGYTKQRTPVVFRNALKEDEIFEKWQHDKYLKQTFGQLNVSVITQRSNFRKFEVKRTPTLMKLKKFLGEYLHEDWYMATTIPREMQEKIALPPMFNCGVLSRYLVIPELWMSAGSMHSRLHSHHDHNLHCVLFGRRDFILIDNRYRYNFAFKETYPHSGEGHSDLDMENLNMYKHTKIKDTPWVWSTLRQGDCILVPSGFLHHVHAHGRSMSYTVLYSPTSELDEDLDDPPCLERVEKARKPMADASFIWSFVDGRVQLSDWNLTPARMRHLLMALLRDDAELHLQRFQHFYENAMSITQSYPPARDVFDILQEGIPNLDSRMEDADGDVNYVTRVDIHRLTTDQLQRVANIFNKPHEGKARDEHMKTKHEEL